MPKKEVKYNEELERQIDSNIVQVPHTPSNTQILQDHLNRISGRVRVESLQELIQGANMLADLLDRSAEQIEARTPSNRTLEEQEKISELRELARGLRQTANNTNGLNRRTLEIEIIDSTQRYSLTRRWMRREGYVGRYEPTNRFEPTW